MLLSKASEGSVEGVESALSSGANIEHKHYYVSEFQCYCIRRSCQQHSDYVFIFYAFSPP